MMRHTRMYWIASFIVTCALTGGVLVSPVFAEEGAGPQSIAVVAIGDVDAELVNAVGEHLRTYISESVEVIAPRTPVDGVSLEEQAAALKELRADHRGVIGLFAAQMGVGQHGAYLPADAVALVNLTALAPDESMTEGTYMKRVKSEAARCGGLILGLKPCPDPRCCMHHYRDEKGLDYKGFNLCPPCMFKARDLAGPASGQPAEAAPPEAAPTESAAPAGAPDA